MRLGEEEYRGLQNDCLVLHLDGDRRYSLKAERYYREVGLRAVVKNIPESKQPYYVTKLLEMYHPDILVVTGHDSLIRSGRNLYNLYNYKNSKYFVETVRMARKWAPSNDKLVIIAGACQSFYEAIMNENADFASSPGRVLIDFVDPIIIAKRVASTDRNKFVSIKDIVGDLNSGIKGIGGGTVRGKKRMVLKK
ncbi:MAG: hypothetical protein LBL91_02875 [Lachnospiraceae bacterium]|nr:hypothetical protein [Lachnospiraceae bacterium]